MLYTCRTNNRNRFKIKKVSPGGPRRMMFKGDHQEIGRERDSWVKIATGRVQQ